jgi:GPH family glycoside/pentoside/hexuronide:cation symporter
MLASAGYVANQVQNAETVQAIMLNISIIPGAVALFGSVFIIGYNLDKKRSAEVREELERRRAARALEEAEGDNQA